LDIEILMSQYGLPLAQWLPGGTDRALFRSLQLQDLSSTELMPGAVAAVESVRRSGGRVVVVTAAPAVIAGAMLSAVGLRVDALHADVWATGKVQPLREARCWAFVGDHTDDMLAARDAGSIAIGVATGTSSPTGADVELKDLTAFPTWLRRLLPVEGLSGRGLPGRAVRG
jgi:uncharacterized protein